MDHEWGSHDILHRSCLWSFLVHWSFKLLYCFLTKPNCIHKGCLHESCFLHCWYRQEWGGGWLLAVTPCWLRLSCSPRVKILQGNKERERKNKKEKRREKSAISKCCGVAWGREAWIKTGSRFYFLFLKKKVLYNFQMFFFIVAKKEKKIQPQTTSTLVKILWATIRLP